MSEYLSWYEMLKDICGIYGDDVDKLVCTLTREELTVKFYAG